MSSITTTEAISVVESSTQNQLISTVDASFVVTTIEDTNIIDVVENNTTLQVSEEVNLINTTDTQIVLNVSDTNVTNLVPYIGASMDVDLGSHSLTIAGTATLPTAIHSTRLNIPNGVSITAANAGDIALDTTDNQLLVGGATPAVLALPKKIISCVWQSPTASDDKPLFQIPYAITLTKVTATVQGGTSVTFNLEKHTSGGLNSAGTAMLSGSLIATTTGTSTTLFASPTLAANQFVNFKSSGLGGTVKNVVIMIEYTITRS